MCCELVSYIFLKRAIVEPLICLCHSLVWLSIDNDKVFYNLGRDILLIKLIMNLQDNQKKTHFSSRSFSSRTIYIYVTDYLYTYKVNGDPPTTLIPREMCNWEPLYNLLILSKYTARNPTADHVGALVQFFEHRWEKRFFTNDKAFVINILGVQWFGVRFSFVHIQFYCTVFNTFNP